MKPPRWRCSVFRISPSPRRSASSYPFVSHSSCLSSGLGYSTTSKSSGAQPTATAATDALSPRWLSELKLRLGRCIQFGLTCEQVHEAGLILGILARDWRELVAGSEGYLTGPQRRGLFKREIVWGEMDSMGHTNNVEYVRHSESGRVRWFQNFAWYLDTPNKELWEELWTPRGRGLILKSIKVDYKFPLGFPDKITVLHKLRSAPGPQQDSFFLDVVILSERHQRPAARAEEDLLIYDYKKGAKTSLPPYMIEQFEQTFMLQEEAKNSNSENVRELIERVRQLEKQSWDRSDAKEDLGSAA